MENASRAKNTPGTAMHQEKSSARLLKPDRVGREMNMDRVGELKRQSAQSNSKLAAEHIRGRTP